MRRIDLEAHFYTKEYLAFLRARKDYPREELYQRAMRLWYTDQAWEPHGPMIDDRLADLGEGRLQAMDESGIDIQVLSLSAPGCEQFSASEGAAVARQTNDELGGLIGRYPGRFIGLAALPLQNPPEAARELERAVRDLGIKGAKVHSHVGDSYLDERQYRIVFEKAAELDVPLYLHPSIPNPNLMKAYSAYGFALAGPAWGFGAEASLQAMRLIYSGIFDLFPNLKIILGHLGEGLIFWLDRIDFVFKKPWMDPEIPPKIKRRPSEYVKDNFIITTGGIFSQPAFLSVYLEMGGERMLFATDYPYEKTSEAVEFIDRLPISDLDRQRIYHLNAEKLFKLE
jgi:5-carboxyvanillate decarboxylase